MCFGEECEPIRSSPLCSCGTMGSQALHDLRDSFLSPSLLRQPPAPQDRTTRPPVRKPLIRSDADGGFRILLGGMPLTAQLMELGNKVQGGTQAKRVCNLPREGHRLVAPCQPLIRIAQQPQHESVLGATHHARVLPMEKCRGTVLLGVVECYTLRIMRVR